MLGCPHQVDCSIIRDCTLHGDDNSGINKKHLRRRIEQNAAH
jgi:hypothetical protein